MQLSRRDALAALAAGGVGSVAGCAAPTRSSKESSQGDGEETVGGSSGDSPVGEHELATLVAVAEAVYPSAVEGVDEFVRTYTGGRVSGDGAYADGVEEAVETLDQYTTEFYDQTYASLSIQTRREALDYMSVDDEDPDPSGTAAQRVRYHLVNEVLYAFYTSPTGASLAGLENPPGYPGGTVSYQEGPDR